MRPARGRGKGDEDLAAPVVRHGSAAREPEACSARDSLELLRRERRIDGDHGDAAARLRAARRRRLAEERSDRHAVHDERRRRVDVRQDQHADRAADRRCEAARRPDAGLVALRHHSRPPADGALRDVARRSVGHRSAGVLRVDLHEAALREPAVVAFADDGNDEVLAPDLLVRADRDRDGAVVDPTNRVRGGEVDGRLDQAPLGDHHRPGQLRCAVQHRHAGGDGRGVERLHRCGHDGGHTRTRDSAPVRGLGLVAPHCDMPYGDAADVRDRIRRARLEAPDPQAEVAEPRAPRLRCAHAASVQTGRVLFMLPRIVACRR